MTDGLWLLPFFACLVAAADVDLRTLTIPDRISAAILLVGALRLLLSFSWQGLWSAVLGLVCVGVLMLIPALIRDSLGGGDVKLCAAAAFVTGLSGAVFALLLSLIPAIVYGAIRKNIVTRRGQTHTGLALAPFLSAGFFTAAILTLR